MDELEPSQGGAQRNEQVNQLIQAYLNENAAPEVLPFQAELVGDLREQLSQQEESIEEVTERADKSVEEVFTASLYQMDIDRVKFALAKYLRVRLLKLERVSGLFRPNLAPELSDAADALRERLSEQELQYVHELEKLYSEHVEDAVLRHFPENAEQLKSLGEADMCQPPRTDRFVFCHVRETVDGFYAHEGTNPLTWEAGDIHVVPYKAIRRFVEDGRMELSAPHF